MRVVVASTTAPAASVGPSPPSVPTLIKTTLRRFCASSCKAADSANSWFLPPLPLFAVSETVVSVERKNDNVDRRRRR